MATAQTVIRPAVKRHAGHFAPISPLLPRAERALQRSGRAVQRSARAAWECTRTIWWPALLHAVRTGLREFGTAWWAHLAARPTLLLGLAVLVLTPWTARAIGVSASPGAPAAPAAQAAPPAEAAPPPAAPPEAPPDGPPCPVSTPPPPPPAGLTGEQIGNARAIAQVARDRGLPERAVVIALATAQQESKLVSLPYGDLDSLGLFQQRPSQGWGTPEQVQDPVYAAAKFYDGLVQVPDWQAGRLTDVAQAVQRSGYPELYQQWEGLATDLAASLAPPAAPSCP
ncbi:hypothetical protein [Geodermatophilus ruber]|uniref:Uncharacterized protein n=1 Tax=Geodermatophilus ruber TaxID=504800 RepID=A0A1I4G9S3_9ACTN|nr:hypothetical protein [Geodermatophilus ruber]SFL26619.1 hypothetical protein SAMN04488085_108214 [Geodermatophilus ruber]